MSFSVENIGCYTSEFPKSVISSENVTKQNCANACHGTGNQFIAIANDPHNIFQNRNMFSCYCVKSLSTMQKYYNSACDRTCINGDACGQDNLLLLNIIATDFRVASIYQMIENKPNPVPVPPVPVPSPPAPIPPAIPSPMPPVPPPVVISPAPQPPPLEQAPSAPPTTTSGVTNDSKSNDANIAQNAKANVDIQAPATTISSSTLVPTNLLQPKLFPQITPISQPPMEPQQSEPSHMQIALIVSLSIISLIIIILVIWFEFRRRNRATPHQNTLTRSGTVFKKPFNAGEFNMFYEKSVPANTIVGSADGTLNKGANRDSVMSHESFRPLFPTRESTGGGGVRDALVRVSEQLKRNDTTSSFGGGILRGWDRIRRNEAFGSIASTRSVSSGSTVKVVSVYEKEKDGGCVKRSDTVATTSSSLFRWQSLYQSAESYV